MTRKPRFVHALALAFLLSTAFPASAGLLDRTPLAPPQSELRDAAPARVVASDGGMFLLHGQRISSGGVRIDAEPVPGTEGYAVGWADGWMIISADEDEYSVLHLAHQGAPEPRLRIPRFGEFVGAASNGGRIAILEIVYGTQPPWMHLVIVNEEGLVQRRPLAQLHGGTISRFLDGFFIATHVRTSNESSILHAWRIDGNGVPQLFAELGTISPFQPTIEIAVNGDRALLSVADGSRLTTQVIDAALTSSDPETITAPFLTRAFPLPFEDGFIVSYQTSVGGPSSENRALIVNPQGELVSDVMAEPIVAGDRSGSRYLIVRPWGHAGLADEDPRRIIAAITLKQRFYVPPPALETVVSGDVTLVAMGNEKWSRSWVRFDGTGTPIDAEPQVLPGRVVVAIPEGFAILGVEAERITLRRLSRRGGWIDSAAIPLVTVPELREFAVHSNDRDLLVAWVTPTELAWTRFDDDGSALQAQPFRVARSGEVTGVSLHGRGDERLVLVQNIFICNILCPPMPDELDALTIDGDGRPISQLHRIDVWSAGDQAVGLTDGTWVVPTLPLEGEVIHLARAGSLLQVERNSMLQRIIDVEPTSNGWKATAGSPSRMIEVIGPAAPSRVTGLGDISLPHFGFGPWLAFLADTPGPEDTPVPWNGRLETIEGDLAIEVHETRRDGRGHHVRVAIRNEGTTIATNAIVTSTSDRMRFSVSGKNSAEVLSLNPGETVYLSAVDEADGVSQSNIFVLSDDIEDIDPSDNLTTIVPPAPPQHRRRGVGR